MAISNAVGRRTKMSMKTLDKLSIYISHNYNISDSCKFAKISRSSYYLYLKSEPIFKEVIDEAKSNQTKVNLNFCTLY